VKTLVLGLGNALYGDDGVGHHVVQKLRCDPEIHKDFSCLLDNVDLEECSLSGLALLDVIVGYDQLIIVDTIKKADPTPGKVTRLKESDLRLIPGPSPHYVSIPQALEIGKKAGLKVPARIDIVAVEAKNLYYLGEGLTEEMTQAIPEIIRELKDLLQQP
jgi:hydrogenase maturation protease